MTNEVIVEQGAAIAAPKPIDFDKIEALRKHMLLTVDSLVAIYGTTRVSYYNWMKGTKMRKATANHIRGVTRKLVTALNQGWPHEAVFVATQPERLQMLQELLETLDKEPSQ